MPALVEMIPDGGVTSAKGYLAGATYAGLKTQEGGVLDLGILLSEVPANLAATFSTNKILSPSVTLSRERARRGTARGVIANSGCANCCVGVQGLTDAKELAELAAEHVDVSPEDMLVCSTGMIGVELPMALLRQNMGNINLANRGGEDFARSIMTTDVTVKQLAVSVEIDGRRIVVGGAAKGVGMIHPNMATMLAFISTDAPVEQGFLQRALSEAVECSFNMCSVDGDQSTNDTVLAFANGQAGDREIVAGGESARLFQDALTYVCTSLAKDMVRDGEGAQKLIEVTVDGARSLADARRAAREIASSSLVKAMVHGNDPNWGRIMMALGKSGVELEESKIDIFVNDIQIVHEGLAIPFFRDVVVSSMAGDPVVRFRVTLNLGDGAASGWGCDLTEEYVTFNSAYST
ncbi:MAG: bifunctional glutamate N-acetyltransferase/amino-acid acetyltransferase ArgJ [Chloroflexi bacterium]|nr:bifunctional glutamate N-acetyltransferase/amino-acid acetyltransferase ArgJ [Chloroflexota bacterium]